MSKLDKLTLFLHQNCCWVHISILNVVILLSSRDSWCYCICGNEIKPGTLASSGVYKVPTWNLQLFIYIHFTISIIRLVLASQLGWLAKEPRVFFEFKPLSDRWINTRWVDSADHPAKVGNMSNSLLETGTLYQWHNRTTRNWCSQAATGCIQINN